MGKIIRHTIIWTGAGLGLFMITMFVTIYLLGPPDLNNQPITIYDDEGEVLVALYPDGQTTWQQLDEINPTLIEATLVMEDRRFYQHGGLDLKRVGGAMLENIRHGRLKEGASTISQQYARNLYLSHERTWTRKLKEAFYALRLEWFYDKDTILEGYFNTIYYGHGIYGAEAASQFYFGKSTDALSNAEIALLVAIPNSPNANSPIDHIQQAKQEQHRVIRRLVDEEILSDTEGYLASIEQFEIVGEQETDPHIGYIADYVINEAKSILGQNQLDGYQLYTTFNAKDQQALSKAVLQHINKDELQVGAITADPNIGAIKAIIGGVNYQESPFNRASQAKRMLGSTFKPILYYTALENGFTAATTLVSEPTFFQFNDGTSYTPGNFNQAYAHDSVTLAQALALSDNIYAIKTQLFLTPERVVEQSRMLGITSELDPVPSLALGTSSVSVLELLTAYSHFANGGYQVRPFSVTRVESAKGEIIYQHSIEQREQVLDPQQTFILNQLLTGMFDPNLSSYLSVTGGSISEGLSGDYAGKSGSTPSDHWMIGYSPELIVAVWTGYDDNRNLEQTQAAKLIWRDAIEAGHSQGSDAFTVPPGIVAAYIDPSSGKLSSEHCPVSRLMFFVEGTEPKQYCQIHDQ